jgi:molybdenum cofactor cytidylyltransferase
MNEFIGIVLLAAGESRRMGVPKQLLEIAGVPLLRRVAEAAVAAGSAQVIVVLGAHAAAIAPCLDGLRLHIVVHPGWAEGLGSSASAGVRAFTEQVPGFRGVIIALADQPNVSAGHFSRLVETHDRTGRPMVASLCRGTLGPPAYFASEYIPALLRMEGDAGARSLFKAHPADLATVAADDLSDIDTPEQYEECVRTIRVGHSAGSQQILHNSDSCPRRGENTLADHA